MQSIFVILIVSIIVVLTSVRYGAAKDRYDNSKLDPECLCKPNHAKDSNQCGFEIHPSCGNTIFQCINGTGTRPKIGSACGNRICRKIINCPRDEGHGDCIKHGGPSKVRLCFGGGLGYKGSSQRFNET